MLFLDRLPVIFMGRSKWNKMKGFPKEVRPVLAGRNTGMAFCPFSAVLFFMMTPLALMTEDAIIIPMVFAIAIGLPAVAASLFILMGVNFCNDYRGRQNPFRSIKSRSAS